MTPSSAFACAIGASMIWLQGCGSSGDDDDVDCTEAFRQKCFLEAPFNTCCFDCGGGSGGQTCDVTQSHSLHGTEVDLHLTFSYDVDDENCAPACTTLKNAHWDDFCDGCDNCVTDDPHVQKCADALSQINQQKPSFCASGKASNSSVAAVVKDEDFCKRAYYAGCWHETPFNSGCCASTCDASAGMERCSYVKTKTTGADHKQLSLNVTFHYDPADDKCNKACKAISQSIWTDFCGGDGSFDDNDDVKDCDAAMQEIHHQVNDVVTDWCGSSLTQQIV